MQIVSASGAAPQVFPLRLLACPRCCGHAALARHVGATAQFDVVITVLQPMLAQARWATQFGADGDAPLPKDLADVQLGDAVGCADFLDGVGPAFALGANLLGEGADRCLGLLGCQEIDLDHRGRPRW
jgi:hypothetical protein